MNKKLVLETKIRDAAVSLSKANATYKNITKQTSEQLDNANRRVELAQKEVWRVSERANEISRKLLEHRAGVLSHSVRALEKKSPTNGDDATTSGYSSPNRSSQMSPTSSVTSIQTASSKGRFDGAHFFAGHSDAVMPNSPRPPQWATDAVAAAAASGVAELEEKLQQLTAALEAATAKQTEMEQELSLVRMEKEEVETTLGMQLQGVQDTIGLLEKDLASADETEARLRAMEEERDAWMNEREGLEDRLQETEGLREKVEELEARDADASVIQAAVVAERALHTVELEAKNTEMDEMRNEFESERAAWDMEKVTIMGDMNAQVARFQQDAASGSVTKTHLDDFLTSLNSVLQTHGVPVAPSPSSPTTLVSSLSSHLEDVRRRLDDHAQAEDDWTSQRARLETDVRVNTDKHTALVGQLDQFRRERDDAQAEIRDLHLQLEVRISHYSQVLRNTDEWNRHNSSLLLPPYKRLLCLQ